MIQGRYDIYLSILSGVVLAVAVFPVVLVGCWVSGVGLLRSLALAPPSPSAFVLML